MEFNEIIISDRGRHIQLKRLEKGRQVLVGYDPASQGATLATLRDKVLEAGETMEPGIRRIVIHNGLHLRIMRVETISGTIYICRRGIERVPPFARLTGLPEPVRHYLVELARTGQSGLLLHTGLPGQGKTVTMHALVRQWVQTWGDVAVVINRTTEFVVDGPIENSAGRIVQMTLDAAHADYDGYLNMVLGLSPRYAAIGSAATALEAKLALDLSMAGVLVCTTVQATDIVAAISNFINRAGQLMTAETAREATALSLKLVLHQQFGAVEPDENDLRSLRIAQLCVNSDQIRRKIKGDAIASLAADIGAQETRIRNRHSLTDTA
jgi:Tfp pilus assembly pilus retraction ATPase PilT